MGDFDLERGRLVTQRYFANLIWSWSAVASGFDGLFNRYVQRCKDIGFDTIRMDVPWDIVEPERGSFDFDWADTHLGFLAREMEMNLVVILNSRDYPAWLGGDELLMRRADGNVFTRDTKVRHYGILSLNSKDAREATAAFYSAAVRHFEAEFGDRILAYSSAWTPEMESEYHHREYLDYSESARTEFKEWLSERGIEGDTEMPLWTDDDERFIRWAAFREWTLKRMFDSLAGAVHDAGAKGKYKVQFGSVWDMMSGRRGSPGFGYSTQSADWVVVDDSYRYDHYFSADVLWGTTPDKMKANEVGGPPERREDLVRFARETYEHGLDMFQLANWAGRKGIDWLNSYERELREIARLRDEAELLPRQEGEMPVSVRELYLSRCDQARVNELTRKYRGGSEDGKKRWPVRFEWDLGA